MRSHIESKIIKLEDIQPILSRWRFLGNKVVFTNGCFDLIHYGHLQYLLETRELGDKLIIGLNSDNSVSRLKGDHRPIKDQKSRLQLLASLAFVDAVVVFEEDTPLKLISTILPDVLVKGGDWKPEDIVGSKEVLANGGKVLSLPFVDGYSTTNLEQKILNSHKS